jgi:predicted metalloprotease
MDPILPDSKACTKCLVEKPLDDFHKRALSKDGLALICKSCKQEQDKSYRLKNAEVLATKSKIWRLDNAKDIAARKKKAYQQADPEVRAERTRDRYLKNKEAICKRTAAYARENKEKVNAAKKIWRSANPEKAPEYQRNYRSKNAELAASKASAYSQKNKERGQELKKIWKAENPEKAREYENRRRALKLGNGAEPYTVAEMLLLYGTDCYLCSEPIDLEAARGVGQEGWQLSLHVDHFQPLSKGGPDSLVNVRPAHGLCNLKKHATWDDTDPA